MLVYRELFESLIGPFKDWPQIQCPSCKLAVLEALTSDIESVESINGREGFTSWNGWCSGYFHGVLACSRKQCGNGYVVTGEWKYRSDVTEEDLDDDPRMAGIEVRHVLPAFPLMDFPEAVPPSVRGLVDAASQVLLSDPSAASTRIRSAIECLLDEQKIRKTEDGKKSNKRTKLHLDGRIKEFQKKSPAAGNLLMAMKNIENVGTHENSPLPLSAALDGVELFARAVDLIYDRRLMDLDRRAAVINKYGTKLRVKHLTR